MKKIFFIFLSSTVLSAFNTHAQTLIDSTAIINSIFPKGEKITASNRFNGTVWLNRYISVDDSLDCTIALVTFSAGVRTNWHMHPGGQILMVVEGIGYYQEKGKPRQVIHKGDIIKCAKGVTHWHGASPDGEFAHLVVAPDAEKGEVSWLQEVTEEQYNGLN